MNKRIILVITFILLFSNISIVSAVWDSYLNKDIRSYWKLNETGTGQRIDSLGLFNGTQSGGAMNTTSGKIGGGAIGDGVNSINFSSAGGHTNTLSISAWIQKTGVAGSYNFRWISDSGGNQIDFNYNDCAQTNVDGLSITISGECTNVINSSLAGSGFRHIVVVVGADIGNRQIVYVDGALITNKSQSAFTNLSNTFRLLNTAPSSMVIDEVGIWTEPLNTTQISNLYNSGTGITFIDTAPLVDLNSPTNNSGLTNSSNIFNFTGYGAPNDLRNATIFIWNSTHGIVNQSNISVSGQVNNSIFNISNIGLGFYKWNVQVCDVNNLCAFSTVNNTFLLGAIINSNTYANPVGELSSTTFILNTTLASGLISSDGYLIYNNERLLATKTTSGSNTLYSRVVNTPNVASPTNVSWTWELDLNSGSGVNQLNVTSGLQQVNALSIDNCSLYSTLILNYSLYDEDNQQFITPSGAMNTTIEVDLILSTSDGTEALNFSKTYSNINPARICFDDSILNTTSYILDVTTKYLSDTRVTEFHNIQNYTLTNNTIPINVKLYDLLVTSSQEFLITFKDSDFIPTAGALIDIQRYYIGNGSFISVEIPKTDNDGRTVGHFVLNDEVYNIYVRKNGQLLAVFENVRAFCSDISTGDCRINLNSAGSTTNVQNFVSFQNVTYYPYYNSTSRTYSLTFFTTDSTSKTVSLNLTVFDNYLNNSVCFQSSTASSGVLSCNIPQSFGNSSVLVQATVNGKALYQQIFKLSNISSVVSASKYILAFLLIVMLPLMAGTSVVMSLVLFIIGLIMASVLVLIDSGGLIGSTSAILWFIIGALILIWRASTKNNG